MSEGLSADDVAVEVSKIDITGEVPGTGCKVTGAFVLVQPHEDCKVEVYEGKITNLADVVGGFGLCGNDRLSEDITESTTRPGEYSLEIFTYWGDYYIPLRAWKPVGWYEMRHLGETHYLDVDTTHPERPVLRKPEAVAALFSHLAEITLDLQPQKTGGVITPGNLELWFSGRNADGSSFGSWAYLRLVTTPF